MPRKWLYSPSFDLSFILLPGTLSIFLVLLLKFFNVDKLTAFWWVILVLMIDVGHVYASLYRTYLDKKILSQYKEMLLGLPALLFLAMLLLFGLRELWFWRVLAYMAVFHFVRQQVGFLKLYQRGQALTKTHYNLEILAIYLASLGPLLWWHLSDPLPITWFVAGDFFHFPTDLKNIFYSLSLLPLIVCLGNMFRYSQFPTARFVLILSTALSWSLGIVFLEGDLAFTATNVIAHGIPYYALVYKEQKVFKPNLGLKPFFFLLPLLSLAFIEEGFWDFFIWQEHREVFFYETNSVNLNFGARAFIITLLTLPQATHYILDGIIWKKDFYPLEEV